jgi:hypothetical protein
MVERARANDDILIYFVWCVVLPWLIGVTSVIGSVDSI